MNEEENLQGDSPPTRRGSDSKGFYGKLKRQKFDKIQNIKTVNRENPSNSVQNKFAIQQRKIGQHLLSVWRVYIIEI